MTLRLHETLQVLRREVIDGRAADGLRDQPLHVEMHPESLYDLLLDDDDYYYHRNWSPARSYRGDTQLLGIKVKDDVRLPEGVLVVTWPDRRTVVLRRLETTQVRAQVRDGVRRAHPWLRLPPPVPPAQPWVKWVFDRLTDAPRADAYWQRGRPILEERYAMAVKRPASFVTGTFAD